MDRLRCLSSNKLKIIAIITMIIDHIGYYFYYMLSEDTYIYFRIIGRIAMPIFVFLIIQGYIHTKNFKKYIHRLLLLAVITQGLISVVWLFNIKYVPNYDVGIIEQLNILFSFVLILLFIKSMDNYINKKNMLLNMLYILIIVLIYFFVPIDYSNKCLILGMFFFLSYKCNNKVFKNILLILPFIAMSFYLDNLYSFMLFSLPIILLYNNKLGSKSNIFKYSMYLVFPIQHTLLFLLGTLLYKYFN